MKISEKELQESLVAALARSPVPGASIAVLHDGKVTCAAAGITNVNTGVEMTPSTLAHIGSITKVLNTTLVMQLVDDGRIELDEPVIRYLPDLQLGSRAALPQITVRMLLNHTSGIDGEMLPDSGHDEEIIEKAIQRFAQLGQLHPPGAEFSYCNAGMVIAGYLVQRHRGKSWYRVMRERILEPLGMRQTATLPEEAVLHRVSVGHHIDPASGHRPTLTPFAYLPLSFAPAGSTMMMSAADLIVFAQTHMALGTGPNGVRILSERSARAMQRATVSNEGKGYTYLDMGLGWMVARDGLLNHIGGSPGVVSTLYVSPKHGFAAAALANADYGFGLTLINEFMAPWLAQLGSEQPFGAARLELPSDLMAFDPDRYVGVYEDLGTRYRVSRRADELMLSKQIKLAYYANLSTEPTPPVRLVPLDANRFVQEATSEVGGDAVPDAFRIFSFRSPGPDGFMRYLGNGLRLYRKLS
jgi:CubicO group peptidase (beta-lactamase class C family)